MLSPAMHSAHFPHGYWGRTTTRSPTLTRLGCATATTSPAPSWPGNINWRPDRKALYSVHSAEAWTLTSAQSALGRGSGTSTTAACRWPRMTAFFMMGQEDKRDYLLKPDI